MDQVLYYLSSPALREPTRRALDDAASQVASLRARSRLKVAYETSVNRARARLRGGFVDALIIDARETQPGQADGALELLEALFDRDVAEPIARQRTWLLVDPTPRGTQLAFEAGRRRVAGTIAAAPSVELWSEVWHRMSTTAARSRSGKIAICLAGGGTEGLLYELGVLRALQRFLPDYNLSNVDIICGISAGAIVGALMANGLDADSISQGLRGRDPRIDPITRTDLFDLNIGGLAQQGRRLTRELIAGRRAPTSALFRLPPAGLFAGKRLERWLQRQLNRDGMIDDFSRLRRRLYVGATDQDRAEHVVFGLPGAPETSIHQAVRASIALAPFYAPHEIGGRYYVDGAFTRTTNTRVAVDEGATMLILVEPLVPISTSRAGYVAEHGAVYTAAQGLKSLINARFTKAIPALRAMFPEVAFHLFQPGGASRRMLSGSPMKFWYRPEIEQVAFDETLREIRAQRADSLERDFARHAVRFVDPDGRSRARAATVDTISAVA